MYVVVGPKAYLSITIGHERVCDMTFHTCHGKHAAHKAGTFSATRALVVEVALAELTERSNFERSTRNTSVGCVGTCSCGFRKVLRVGLAWDFLASVRSRMTRTRTAASVRSVVARGWWWAHELRRFQSWCGCKVMVVGTRAPQVRPPEKRKRTRAQKD